MKYLIDFENVANNGFDGLGELRPSDELLIFYSEQHSTISITVHQALEKSLVHKSYMPVKTGGKNALDFQLVTWLGHEISQNPKEQFVIVSKDTGFDVVVDFWQKRGIGLVRSRSLKGTKSILKKMRNILPEHSEAKEELSSDKNKLDRLEAADEAPKKDTKEASKEKKEKKSRDGKKKKGEKNKKREPDEPMMTDSPEKTQSKPARRRKSGKGKQQNVENKNDSREEEKQKLEKPSKRKPSKKQEKVPEVDAKEEKQKRRGGSRRRRRKKSNASDTSISA